MSRGCPDGGLCRQHGTGLPECEVGCRRVALGPPTPGVYPDDQWPESVRDTPPPLPPSLAYLAQPYAPGNPAFDLGAARAQQHNAIRAAVDAAARRAQHKRAEGWTRERVNITLDYDDVLALQAMLRPTWERFAESSRYAELAPSQLDVAARAEP